MQREKLTKSVIIRDFRSFYEEVVRLKARALSGDFVTEQPEREAEGQPASLCRYIQKRLLDFFTHHRLQVERQGGEFAVRYYQEAQYIMVALADEVFLTLPWNGRDEWRDNLLETQVFHTQVAGEKIFDMIDSLLGGRDIANSDMGVLYTLVLGLGFKGRYRDMDDKGALKLYRDRLRQCVARKDGAYEESVQRLLFPEAYLQTLETTDGLRVPSARPWAVFLGITALGYLIVAYILWIMNIREIEKLIDQIRMWMQTQ